MSSKDKSKTKQILLHFIKAGQKHHSGDVVGCYNIYADTVDDILLASLARSTLSEMALIASALPPGTPEMTSRYLLIDSLHAIASGFSYNEIRPDTSPRAASSLKKALDYARKTPKDYEVGILAAFGLARLAYDGGKREEAAAKYKEAVLYGDSAKSESVTLGNYAMENLKTARENLGSMQTHEMGLVFATEDQIRDAQEGKSVRVEHADGSFSVINPASELPMDVCSACGKQAAALSKCQGGCKPRAAYCNANCQRSHWATHKQVCGKNAPKKEQAAK